MQQQTRNAEAYARKIKDVWLWRRILLLFPFQKEMSRMPMIFKLFLILCLSVSRQVLIMTAYHVYNYSYHWYESAAVLSTKHKCIGFPAINSSLFQVYKIGHFGYLACSDEKSRISVQESWKWQAKSYLWYSFSNGINFANKISIFDSFGRIHWKKWSTYQNPAKIIRNQRTCQKSFQKHGYFS